MTAVVQVDGIRVTAVDAQDAEVVDLGRWGTLLANGLSHEGVTGTAEASVSFVDSDTIAGLKAEHLGGDGQPTDVLAFPIDSDVDCDADCDAESPMPRLVGDIVICPGFARANVGSTALDDELALLVVHGLLHLLGHDHAEPHDAVGMKAREQVLLGRFHRCDNEGAA